MRACGAFGPAGGCNGPVGRRAEPGRDAGSASGRSACGRLELAVPTKAVFVRPATGGGPPRGCRRCGDCLPAGPAGEGPGRLSAAPVLRRSASRGAFRESPLDVLRGTGAASRAERPGARGGIWSGAGLALTLMPARDARSACAWASVGRWRGALPAPRIGVRAGVLSTVPGRRSTGFFFSLMVAMTCEL